MPFHSPEPPAPRSHRYSAERSDLALTLPKCRSTCRALEFSGDGGQLFSGWADGSLRVHSMETGALRRRLPAAHPAGVYSVLPLTERIVASGDDDGTVKRETRRPGGRGGVGGTCLYGHREQPRVLSLVARMPLCHGCSRCLWQLCRTCLHCDSV